MSLSFEAKLRPESVDETTERLDVPETAVVLEPAENIVQGSIVSLTGQIGNAIKSLENKDTVSREDLRDALIAAGVIHSHDQGGNERIVTLAMNQHLSARRVQQCVNCNID